MTLTKNVLWMKRILSVRSTVLNSAIASGSSSKMDCRDRRKRCSRRRTIYERTQIEESIVLCRCWRFFFPPCLRVSIRLAFV